MHATISHGIHHNLMLEVCVLGADPDIGKRAFGVRGSIAIATLLYSELFLT